MRASFLLITSFALAACGPEAADPRPDRLIIVSGSLRYTATTLAGEPLLSGRLNIDVREDSTIVGTWSTAWAPGADTTLEVGDQVGSGTLSGRHTESGAHIDLNPGYADNNVILLPVPAETGFTGTWYWSSIAGPQTYGRFTALRE